MIISRPTSTSLRRLIIAGLLLAATAGPIRAGEYQDDLKARRVSVLRKLDAGTVMIAWSAPARVYSTDVNYEYRQDSNLLYLAGLDQEETILVLMPGAATKKEVIFVREPNARREHWNGHTLTREEVTAQTGIETVYFLAQFEPFITTMFNARNFGLRRGETTTEWNAFQEEVKAGRGKLALLLGPRPAPSQELPEVYVWANKFRDRFFGVAVTDAKPIVRRAPARRRSIQRFLTLRPRPSASGRLLPRRSVSHDSPTATGPVGKGQKNDARSASADPPESHPPAPMLSARRFSRRSSPSTRSTTPLSETTNRKLSPTSAPRGRRTAAPSPGARESQASVPDGDRTEMASAS